MKHPVQDELETVRQLRAYLGEAGVMSPMSNNGRQDCPYTCRRNYAVIYSVVLFYCPFSDLQVGLMMTKVGR